MNELRGFAVLGHPIGHSLSPRIHDAGFRARGLEDCRYVAVDVPQPESWADVVKTLRQDGFWGFNLTRPLKELVASSSRLTTRDRWAVATGAVNTLMVGGSDATGVWSGANTDAPAFLQSVEARSLTPRTALVFGSGGAARASLAALEAAGAAVTLAARRPPRFPVRWVDMEAGLYAARDAELVVNATPVGQAGEGSWSRLPVFSAGQTVVDWVYAPPATPFLQAAAAGGARCIGGIELLVRQAALAWVHWFGEAGPLAAMGRAVGWDPP